MGFPAVLLKGLSRTLDLDALCALAFVVPTITAVPGCLPFADWYRFKQEQASTLLYSQMNGSATGSAAARSPAVSPIMLETMLIVGCDFLNCMTDVPLRADATLNYLYAVQDDLGVDFGDRQTVFAPSQTDFDVLRTPLRIRDLRAVREWFEDVGIRIVRRELTEFCQPAQEIEPPSLAESQALLETALRAPVHQHVGGPDFQQLYDDYVTAVDREIVRAFHNDDSYARDPLRGEAFRQLAEAARMMHVLAPLARAGRVPEKLQLGVVLGGKSVQECYDGWQNRYLQIYTTYFPKFR